MFRRFTLLFVVAVSFFAARPALPQEHEYVRRLHAPATVKGFIGGEPHDSYVIEARAGQVMTVQISWRPVHDHDEDTGDNHAEFWVGTAPDFDGDGAVKFGQESDNGRRWTGKIPKTGKYYIYVMAHPVADYILKVIVK